MYFNDSKINIESVCIIRKFRISNQVINKYYLSKAFFFSWKQCRTKRKYIFYPDTIFCRHHNRKGSISKRKKFKGVISNENSQVKLSICIYICIHLNKITN